MKRSTDWGTFIRRLSVFYVLLIILFSLFLIYYYYYVPQNESEFNDRAHRELKRLVDNFVQRHKDLQNTFSQVRGDDSNFHHKTGSYEKLNENIPYEIIN